MSSRLIRRADRAPAGAALPGPWVSGSLFAAQMRALARAGYRAVTLGRVVAAWTAGAPLPARPLVVSFDDGYRSDYTRAAPVLRRLGWAGTLNLELRDAGAGGLSYARIRRLIRDGWEVDSHTLTHPDLTTVSAARLRRELVASRAEIRRRLGQLAAGFCYPSGRYDARAEAAVGAAGYRTALTERPGWARPPDDRVALPRIRVAGGESPAALLSAIAAGR